MLCIAIHYFCIKVNYTILLLHIPAIIMHTCLVPLLGFFSVLMRTNLRVITDLTRLREMDEWMDNLLFLPPPHDLYCAACWYYLAANPHSPSCLSLSHVVPLWIVL